MGRRTRTSASIALAMVAALLGAYLGAAFVVRHRVLDADTYSRALARSDAYNRVYTEVLTDPALTETVGDLLGGLSVDPALAPDATATTTNALRWALPPERVQDGVDTAIEQLVGYLRGDLEEYRPTVTLSAVLDRVDQAAVTFTRTLLARAETVEVRTVGEYRTEVEEFVDSLVSGRVPGDIPVLADSDFDRDAAVEVILEAIDRTDDAELRAQVASTLQTGDGRNALAEVAADAVGPYVREQVAVLAARGGDGDGRFDVVAELSDRAHESVDDVASSLETARSAAGWFGPGPMGVAAAALAATVAGLVALNRGRGRRLALLLAGAIVGAAVLFLGIFRLVGAALTEPLDAATGTGPGSWNLPDGVRGVFTDVAADLGDQVRGEVWSVASVLGLLALAAAVAAAVVHLVRAWRAASSAAEAGAPTTAFALRPVAAGVAGLGLVAGAVFVGTGVADADPAAGCNGHVELCDRPYDEVVQAATHNSMSSPDVVKIWPEQDGTMTAQLEAGIRTLLIDSHYWRRVDSAADLVDSVDASSLPMSHDVAAAVLSVVGDRAAARPGTFLCHNACVYGGQAYVDGLLEVRSFLEANPREVVTLIVQDDITRQDTQAAFEAAGLEDLLYDHSDPWPTLGELISRDQRLVVFAEHYGGSPRWYRDAFSVMQDTSFRVTRPADFDCELNRGSGDKPLFLLNHWVSRVTPSRADAAIVNERSFLLERARRCAEERGRLPNFLAVDFYNIGDVVAVADELNGVG